MEGRQRLVSSEHQQMPPRLRTTYCTNETRMGLKVEVEGVGVSDDLVDNKTCRL